MDIVMRDIWQSVEGMPEWNKGVDYSQIIARPTEHFDIISVSLFAFFFEKSKGFSMETRGTSSFREEITSLLESIAK